MTVVDHAALPEIPMRAGITGKWLVGPGQGVTALSVLSNTVQPGVSAPRHFHAYEEVILVEAGQIWVELGDVRLTASPGQSVVIPSHTPHAWGATGPDILRVLFIWPVLEPFAPGNSTYLEGEPPRVAM